MKKKQIFNGYQTILRFFKYYLNILTKNLQIFDQKYPYTSQTLQLSFIYFFACIDLIYSILNNMFSLGIMPEILVPALPIINGILESPILKIWASPEKVFLMSYIVLELMVVRSALNFSKFIKYNILLIFALLMIQGLIISLWDLLFHREIADVVSNWTYDEGLIIGTDRQLAGFFFFLTFVSFISIYYHFYSNALKAKIVTLSGLHWVTDSVAFWLRIKTPTMNFKGKKKGNNSNEE